MYNKRMDILLMECLLWHMTSETFNLHTKKRNIRWAIFISLYIVEITENGLNNCGLLSIVESNVLFKCHFWLFVVEIYFSSLLQLNSDCYTVVLCCE